MLAAILIVIGVLLAPLALVTSWSRVVLSDTEAVATALAPLAEDPQVQAYVADQVVGAISGSLDIDGVVGEVFDGLSGVVGERPLTQRALERLRLLAVDGINSAISGAVTQVVQSDAFAEAWSETVRLSHSSMVSLLAGDENSTLTITDTGVGLRLGPVVERVTELLTERGFAFAAMIPTTDRTIDIIDSESVVKAQGAYRAAVTAGYWLTLIALGSLIAGVLLSINKARATLWVSFGLGLGAAAVLGALTAGRALALVSVAPAVLPQGVVRIFYASITEALHEMALAMFILAIMVGLGTWLFGPFTPALRLRAAYSNAVTRSRGAADA